MKDYYSILQIKPEATKEEIKAAYRRLAKKYHPDVNGGASWAEERFKELQEAYSVLSDYFQKADYDREYAAYYRRNSSSAPKPSSAENTTRSQTADPNRSTPTQQASRSKPQEAAQTKRDYKDYVKDNPRRAQEFSQWMNFDKSSKNSIFDGIKSGKKLRFEFANKVAAWFRILIVFGQLFGITALIVIFPMDGQRQLEQVLGTKLTFNSFTSNVEYASRIDDAPDVTHSATLPKHSYRQTETPARNKVYSPSHDTESSSPPAYSGHTHSYTSSHSSTISRPHSASSVQPSPSGSGYSGNSSIVSPSLSGTSTAVATRAKSAQAVPQAPDKVVYWASLNDGLIHNSSCSQYCSGVGYYTTSPTANNCPQCGGAKKAEAEKKESEFFWVDENTEGVYWYSFEDGMRHRDSCEKFGRGSGGYYTKKQNGRPCPMCCHDESDASSRQGMDRETEEDLYWISASDRKVHNKSCIWYGKYQGHYSTILFGQNCPICGGATVEVNEPVSLSAPAGSAESASQAVEGASE